MTYYFYVALGVCLLALVVLYVMGRKLYVDDAIEIEPEPKTPAPKRTRGRPRKTTTT